MRQGEFTLIEKYFNHPAQQRNSEQTVLGIGDDAAVVNVPDNQQLVLTMDTLIADRHFPAHINPADIAYKSLAVNVSDLVAMAATPSFFLLSLSMPDVDEVFLESFSSGLFNAADEFNIALVGGDTCKGDLSITIQASGFVAADRFVRRSGARVGDKVLVSGELGAAALGLASVQEKVSLSEAEEEFCLQALHRPSPRIDLIHWLRKYASSAIDLSDGLVGDLGHILNKSAVGAIIDRQKIPLYRGLTEYDMFDLCLTGGDDYQILFTVAEKNLQFVLNAAEQESLELFVIGDIVEQGYFMIDQQQSIDLTTFRGFDHFVR